LFVVEDGLFRPEDLLSRGDQNFPAADLGEQLIQIRRHKINHFETEGILGGDRFALPNRLFDPLFVPSPLPGYSPDIGHGIVFHLLAHRLVHTAADPQTYGMGSPDVCPRRHRGDVSGRGNDHTGRGRPRSRWGDINNDRDGGVKDPLGDVPHGQIQTAGCIKTNDQPLRIARRRFVDALQDVFGDRRGDGGADGDHVKDRRLLRCRGLCHKQYKTAQQ
jgi:hypothetical protein